MVAILMAVPPATELARAHYRVYEPATERVQVH